jgi:hypothetical protein
MDVRTASWWLSAIAAVVLTTGLSAATAGPAYGGPVDHSATKSGFHVSGHGRVFGGQLRAAGLVIDSSGADHVLAWNPSGRGDYRFYVRKHGSRKFTHTAVKYNPSDRQHTFAAETVSTSGRKVDAIFVGCSGILTSDAPGHARRLPKPGRAVPGRGCDADDGLAVSLDGFVALPHGRLALLVNDGSETAGSSPLEVWSGRPGSRFTMASAQPTAAAKGIEANTLRFQAFVRDPVTDHLDIVLETESLTDTTLSLSSLAPGGEWTNPKVIATLAKSDSGNRDYGVAAATTYNGQLTLGIQATVPKPGHPNRSIPGAYILGRSLNGAPVTTSRLPHSADGDGDLKLFTNRSNGRLHAAFDRIGGNGSGIYEEQLVGKTSPGPARLAKGAGRYLGSLALTPHGQPVVGFSLL